jgi:hypothetical protein
MDQRALSLGLASLLVSCSGSSNLVPLAFVPVTLPPVAKIAVNLTQDKYSVGTSLRFHVAYYPRAQGFAVIETPCDESTPQGLECLRGDGVDAIMTHQAGTAHDSWLVSLVATATGQAMAAISWQSAWCAMRGSACDNRTRQRAREEAGVEIGRFFAHALGGAPRHSVQEVSDGGHFVINGKVFHDAARTLTLEPGDKVRFLSESAFGSCETARLLVLRTQEVHEVECHY